jgi:MFS family permease
MTTPSKSLAAPRMQSAAPWLQVWYGTALFLGAAGALVMEIVAGRLLAPYVGMSLYTWTAIIAVVLAGLSLGHWIGGRLAGPHVDGQSGSRRVALAFLLAAAASLASLGILRVVSGPLLGSGASPIAAIVLLATAMFFLPSLFVGVVSPILTKLALDDAPGRHGMVLGRMFALGSIGSIAGTLAAGYLFISWIGSTGTVLCVAGLYAALGIGFSGGRRAVAGSVASVAFGALAIGAWLQQHAALTSPCLEESDYYCIRIDDFTRASRRPSTVMVLDHLGHSISDRNDPQLLYTPYVHFVDEMARRRMAAGKVPDALFIGGGGYTLPRAWAARDPAARLVVAEIDPAVTAVARRQMWLRDAPELQIMHRDGRAAVQTLPRAPAFDVVFLDAFHDLSVPSHLVTLEFHREVRDRLRPGGFYALNAVDSGARPRFLLAMLRTLQAVFPSVTVWVEDDGGAQRRLRNTFILVAGIQLPGVSRLQSAYGLERRWRTLDGAALQRLLAETDVPLLTDDFAPVDRLLSHVLTSAQASGE